MKYCYIDVTNGMFTDQLWVNYAPLFFEGVHVLKNPGYNVANWNLYEREIEKRDDTYFVNGTYKLKFFHFSHYKFGDPYLISARQNRHKIEDIKYMKEIIDEYQERLIQYNHESFSKIPCYYQLVFESQPHNTVKPAGGGGLRNIVRKAKNKAIHIARRSLLPQLKTR